MHDIYPVFNCVPCQVLESVLTFLCSYSFNGFLVKLCIFGNNNQLGINYLKIVYCAAELTLNNLLKLPKESVNNLLIWRILGEIDLAWIRIPTMPLMSSLGKLFNMSELQFHL